MSRRARRPGSPLGTQVRSRRVAAVLGVKPNSMTWAQYHGAARRAPWTLDAMRSARPGAEPPRLSTPARPLHAAERTEIARAHDDLAAGRIGGESFLAIVRRATR